MNPANTKLYSLAILGKEWENAYIKFKPFSVSDIQVKFPPLATKLKNKDVFKVGEGMDITFRILQEHFISGKAVNEKQELVDLTADDLEDFPLEVIADAFLFLARIESRN